MGGEGRLYKKKEHERWVLEIHPLPLVLFLGNSCGKRKKRKRKKCPTIKGDNRITGIAANTLCLRHSMQNAYSNRNFFFFCSERIWNVEVWNVFLCTSRTLDFRLSKGHCQHRDHIQHLKHFMGIYCFLSSWNLPTAYRRHGFWNPSNMSAAVVCVHSSPCPVKEMRPVSSVCCSISSSFSLLWYTVQSQNLSLNWIFKYIKRWTVELWGHNLVGGTPARGGEVWN